ncbi:MAG TPA: C25 family cysteine peptidase [Bacteroidales bacterium]|nr:C25 family cysteine peptidase [Bacteroidales bacterium]HRZ49525.1 C25 family cysteine peptidase [Bacteroidales bacterium]
MKKFRRIHFICLLLLMSTLPVLAQVPAGNDWALQHLQQDFWKFPVYRTGIHRIDSTTLAQAGILSKPGFDPRKIQMFHQGKEIPVYIEGESDGVFNTTDFLEFFGRRNDGTMDKAFFQDTAYQVNVDYSLYTDTAYYFITLGTGFLSKRLTYEQANDYNNFLPAENYFITRTVFEPVGTYSGGSYFGDDYSKDSRYMDGEGWIDFPFGIDNNLTNPREVNLVTQGVYSAGPPSELKFSLVGRSKYTFKFPAYPNKNHHVKLTMQGYAPVLDDITYLGYSVYRNTLFIPTNTLSTTYASKFIFTAIDDMSTNPSQDDTRSDRNAIARMELTFPHGTNLLNSGTRWMWIDDQTTKAKTYLSLTNLTSATQEAILYDLTNERRIKVTVSGTSLQMLIPNSLPGKPSSKECFLASAGNIYSVPQIFPLSSGSGFQDLYTDFSQNNYDYLIVTHTSLLPAANQYAAYRKNNGYPSLYNPVVLDIETLYEQFSYGIRNNPMALENCLKFLHLNQLLPPYILVLGKGYTTTFSRKDSLIFRQSLVPGWGYPATDNMYLGRITGSHLDSVSIGRIAAPGPAEVLHYLDKVMMYEDSLRLCNELWMKRAVHLGGGNNATEQSTIKTSLSAWENHLTSPYFGGHVTTFLKTTTEPMEIIKSKQLKDLINSGIRIMTFYGHGSATGFDISTDEVQNYENEGRYPVVIVNSCYSGDLFNKVTSKSEEFILTPKKGGIAYVGSTNYSTIQVLNEMNDTLYRHISTDGYGQPLGRLVRASLKPLTNYTTSFYHLTSYQQSALHGDPALVLSVHDKPDYRTSAPLVYFTPSSVTNELDTFSIHVISQNTGKAIPGNFNLRISRKFPSGFVVDTLLVFPCTAFQDTFSLTMQVDRINGLGLNQFEVELDALYEVNEYDETNNKVTVPLYIKSASLVPVYPYEFAIVPDPVVTLRASTTDPFSGEKKYHFQISQDPDFNTTLATHIQNGKGGIFSWTPPITLADSMVYFWRVALDSAYHPEGKFDWRTSSFQYIQGRTGWSQSHFRQFSNDDYQYIRQDTIAGKYRFVDNFVEITAQTGLYPLFPANQHYYAVNGVIEYQSAHIIDQNLQGGFVFAVFDTLKGAPLISDNQSATWDGPWGSLQPPGTAVAGFEFPTYSAGWQQKLIDFFDSIPAGYYVLGYSIKNHNAPSFPEPLYQAFESIGSSMIRTLPSNAPYVIFGKKGAAIGDPQWVKEKMKTSPPDSIRLDKIITARWNSGHIISTDIGPAKEWNALYWKQFLDPADPYASDIVTFSVYGIDAAGNPYLFPNLANMLAYPDSLLNLDQFINADQFPVIRLQVAMKDLALHTPAQMESWKVLYQPVGETALDPASCYIFYKDTIQQGDTVLFRIATRNISGNNMDSLLVRWWLTDGQRNKHFEQTERYRVHPAGDTLYTDTLRFSTRDMAPGQSTLWIEMNPPHPLTGKYDQPEQTHVNNIGERLFLITSDTRNPLLDVTFDGVHILDGDIVSARPMIEIQLNDENKFFLFNQLQDTTYFRIYLRYPDANEFIPVFFRKDGLEQMVFYPASGTENRCRILFPADFLGKDGKYILRVEATDKAQNEAGSLGYQVSFRVISEATITEALNWPNPFSTRTHFVFTLTGYEVPTDFRIQIMNISGKMIRELTPDELGPLHIGRNITTGFWDGRDAYGDQVANGVYLYRVLTQLKGEQLEKSSTGADRYFTQGWGKMYLMR